jgi:hypothetical protein
VIGLTGLALWRRLDSARIYGWLLAAGYGLHLVSAIGGLAIALWPAQRTARRGLADRGA